MKFVVDNDDSANKTYFNPPYVAYPSDPIAQQNDTPYIELLKEVAAAFGYPDVNSYARQLKGLGSRILKRLPE